MSNNLYRAFVTFILVFALLGTPASAVERTVNCDRGQSIQAALDTAPAASPDTYIIAIRGTCRESISIRRSNITIDGNIGPTPPTIEGRVNILVPNVTLQFITITGPAHGVRISTGGDASLVNVDIVNNDGEGLFVRRQGFALLVRTTISGNNGPGALVEGASLDLSNSDISGNLGPGIIVDAGSDVTIRGSTVIGNGEDGVQARFHSIATFRDSSQIFGNAGHGASASEDSAIRIMTGDVYFPDSIFCDDGESSFANYEGVATGFVSCTGFDHVVP